MSQKKRTTRPCDGRHGSTDSVDGSGNSSKSERLALAKPRMDEASIEMPSRNARDNSRGMMEIFFCVPKISQNARRMNLTSFSMTYCMTS